MSSRQPVIRTKRHDELDKRDEERRKSRLEQAKASFRAKRLGVEVVDLDITSHAQQYSNEAIEVLAKIMLDEKTHDRYRIMAADKILDRSEGKARSASTDDSWIDEMSDVELEAAAIQIMESRKQRGKLTGKVVELNASDAEE